MESKNAGVWAAARFTSENSTGITTTGSVPVARVPRARPPSGEPDSTRGTPAFALRFLLGGACLAALEFLRETIEYAPANYAFLILAGIVATVVVPWIFVTIEARLPRPELPQAPA